MKHSYKVGQVVSHVEHPELVGVIVQLIVLGFIVGGSCDNEQSDTCPPYEHDDDITEQEYNDPWYRIVWINEHNDSDHMFETPTTKYNGQESEGQLVPIN